MDDLTSTSLNQNQHIEAELGLRGEVHSLQADCRMKELDRPNRIREFSLKRMVELMELEQEYKRRERGEKTHPPFFSCENLSTV
ncbi:dynein regulatory complex subunit 4-like [Xyrichtys novacula]|uniref:Dynein regulatory complex subunit 4-like n=1 Tax=Xyrichtys novacula TaxID=13765 RepID=A0AAV1GDD0_XYRNO|nr:dynein regulatory complex subunit 4-like [Xyrichtys novacula]